MRLSIDRKTGTIAAIVVVVALGAFGGYLAFGRSSSSQKPTLLQGIVKQSYAGFQDRANASEAQANVRSAVPAVEAWYQDHTSYLGLNLDALLKDYDPGLRLDAIDPALVTKSSYCIQSTVGGHVFSKKGPMGEIVEKACG